MSYRVNFFTEEGELFEWYTTKNQDEARGLRRKIKNGYATIETVV